MNDDRRVGRVEIGQDPNEARSAWARPRGDEEPAVFTDAVRPTADPEVVAHTSAASAEPSSNRRGVERRRLLAAAAAIVVTALLVWWVLARADGDPATDDGAASVTTVALPVSGVTVRPADSAATESTESPRVTAIVRAPEPAPAGTLAATSAPRWTSSSVEVDPRAVELGIDIVAVMPSEIAEYKTGAGERASMSTAQLGLSGQAHVEAGRDWVLVHYLDAAETYMFEGRDSPVRLDDGGGLFRQPGTDDFWKLSMKRAPDTPLDVFETDHLGHEAGVSFQAGRWATVVDADPAGGLLVEAPGGAYQIGPDGSRRITTGKVLALNLQTALVLDCGDDDAASCELIVVDRTSGATRPLTPVVSEPGAEADYLANYMGAISPDNRYAPLFVYGITRGFGVVDLTNGEFTSLTGWPPQELWWAPDSRTVVYIKGSRLFMYDFDEHAEISMLPQDTGGVLAFAVRT